MNKLRYLKNGFTLIEVLVTLIVILLGLLGIATLQAKSQQAQLEAYQRSQAIILLNDMANRINANRTNRSAYLITAKATGDKFAGVEHNYTLPIANPIAETDIRQWSDALEGAAEVAADRTTGGIMIGARGCIWEEEAGNNRIITISVAWQGINPTVIQANNQCATGTYGDNEAQRRVISTTIQIANLNDPPPPPPSSP